MEVSSQAYLEVFSKRHFLALQIHVRLRVGPSVAFGWQGFSILYNKEKFSAHLEGVKRVEKEGKELVGLTDGTNYGNQVIFLIYYKILLLYY